jgi:uncharacterized protein YndB with AHSA1/START domain
MIAAPVGDVWSVVSDPEHLPRWWPRTERVENVRRVRGGRRSQWTKVLQAKSGKSVRADFRCVSAAENERYVWEQDVADTPFERLLRSSVLEIALSPADGATEVTLASRQRLRGLSRLGSPMMRRATGRLLTDALEGLETALGRG